MVRAGERLIDDLMHVKILICSTAPNERHMRQLSSLIFIMLINFVKSTISGFNRVITLEVIISIIAGFLSCIRESSSV